MRETLARGNWDEGYTVLTVTDEPEDAPVEGYESKKLMYGFKSLNENRKDSPCVEFTSMELRELIRQTRLNLGTGVFSEPDFEKIQNWYDTNGEGVVAEIGREDGYRKQFKISENDDNGKPYFKIQRFSENGGNLQTLPTMGRQEFEQIFSGVAIL
ncbi:hypothetical protein [Haloarchaeobius sp. HME9146]|uniref:hypothetical protein n=1 Tax=Haloarchaeobius sp. HME9146 TaxID=2978732 RepID=UPI0021BE3669|nr:hypothetical protein [Haloarchaeobius sp. HME9146]MCT9095287.1 hypothetical protein [Haloarchaeobius sp. HME9146]